MLYPTDSMAVRRLNIKERIAHGEKITMCQTCFGTGAVSDMSGFSDYIWETCRRCHGKGYMELSKKNQGERNHVQW